MNHATAPLAPGLYLVSTPIGNARDITLRALDVLAAAGAIAAEDTRTARKLMEIHGVALNGRRITAYHDHSGPAERGRIVEMIRAGQAVAYVSEAGTPLLADPGFQLARAVREAGLAVWAVPGASALLAALVVAGLPTDRFLFAESPKRIAALLEDLETVMGPDRQIALCRELTKKFEETRTGTVTRIREGVRDSPPRGEIVLLVHPAPAETADDDAVRDALVNAMLQLSLKDAVNAVSGATGRPRRDVYQIALMMKDGS